MTWMSLAAFVLGAFVALWSVSFANGLRRKREEADAWRAFQRALDGK